jgi:hypothetical protein
MTSPTAHRPGLVTLLVVLTVLGGIVSIIAGVIAMIAVGSVVSAGVVLVGLGLIYLAVAKGLSDGNGWARAVVAVVSFLQVVFAVLTIFRTDDGSTRNSAISTAVFGLVILLILYSPKANEFFGSRSR